MFGDVSLTRPANPVRVAIVVGLVLVGVNVLIWAGRSQVNGPATVQRNPEIIVLEPNESDQLLPQGEVGAQLSAFFNAQISIDGRVIPQDQVTSTAGANTVFFDPGPGKDIREFTKGGHTAVLEWWPTNLSTAEAARAKQQLRSYTWSFNVG
ncbi:MAG: hypothetical protein QOJ71_642 [Actinomycetota bacterium]|jgi:hypothetical protein|nr:hypothetical protein [Actinomycetota bacterium]